MDREAGALSPNRIGVNYYSSPSWITSTRLVTHGGYGSQMMIQSLGGVPAHWYDDGDVDEAYEDLRDGAISRDGSRLAVVRSYGSTTHLAMASRGRRLSVRVTVYRSGYKSVAVRTASVRVRR